MVSFTFVFKLKLIIFDTTVIFNRTFKCKYLVNFKIIGVITYNSMLKFVYIMEYCKYIHIKF